MAAVILLVPAACSSPQPVLSPPPSVVLAPAPEERNYRFQLAPEVQQLKRGYTRREIENFLFCTSDGGLYFPDALDMTPRGEIMRGNAFIQPELTPERRRRLLQQEVSRWFENKVSVRLRGTLSPQIRRTVARFFSEVNQCSGSVHFVVLEGTGPANIVVRVGREKSGPHARSFLQVGESSGLNDRLRVHLKISGSRLIIDPFTATARSQPRNARFVHFTPRDLDFLKRQRMVKVFVQRMPSPGLQKLVLVHELLHAIGFPGHSPFRECELFPLTAANNPQEEEQILSTLSRSLVEMIYRPEILAGMNLKEAARALSRLPRLNDTPPAMTRTWLQKRHEQLVDTRNRLLQAWYNRFRTRMNLLVRLDGLRRREREFFLEWRELFTDEGKNPFIIDLAMGATKAAVKRSIVNFRMHRLTHLFDSETNPRKRALIREEQVILKDLMAAEKRASEYESRIHGEVFKYAVGERPEEKQMRPLVRQLMQIRDRLSLTEHARGGT